jgi:hypothetical protein
MCRVSPRKSNGPRVLAQYPVNDIGMQVSACRKAFAIVTHRPEEWSLNIFTMPGKIEIITSVRGWSRGKKRITPIELIETAPRPVWLDRDSARAGGYLKTYLVSIGNCARCHSCQPPLST